MPIGDAGSEEDHNQVKNTFVPPLTPLMKEDACCQYPAKTEGSFEDTLNDGQQ